MGRACPRPSVSASSRPSSVSARSTAARERGTGLGLAIARGFIEAHNGTIRVETTIGGGATFVVSLPLAEERRLSERPGRSLYDVQVVADAVPLRYRLPNALTVARLVALPFFWVLLAGAPDGQSVAAGVLFAVASLTDWLDGYLARRLQYSTRFGRMADPLADRLLIDSAVLLLWWHDRLPLDRAGADPQPRHRAADRAARGGRARLRADRDLPRQGRDRDPDGRARTDHGDPAGRALARLSRRGRARVSRCSRAPSTSEPCARACASKPTREPDARSRDGGWRGDAATAAHLEPAQADGADLRQAVHRAHRRARAPARDRRRRRDARLHAAGDPQLPGRRQLAGRAHRVRGRGAARSAPPDR